MKKTVVLIGVSVALYLGLLSEIKIMGSWIYWLANVSGLVGATLLMWQMILGLRFVSSKLAIDYLQSNKLHQFLGKYGFAFILLHPLLESVVYQRGIKFLWEISLTNQIETFMTVGRIALLLILVLWVTSVVWRKKLSYRKWQFTHYLSYVGVGLVILHARQIGTFLAINQLVFWYWQFWTGLYFVIVGLRLAHWFRWGKQIYILKKKQEVANDWWIYKLRPTGKKIVPQVGQFVYVRGANFWEEHPISIMKYDKNSGEVTLGIKTVGKFTNKLSQLNVGDKVYLDGPYGVFTRNAWTAKAKVILAGGIGVTPFVELINKYGDKRTYLFHAIRQPEEAVEEEKLKQILDGNYVKVISSKGQRLDEKLLKSKVDTQVWKQAGFWICGSPRFVTGMKSLLESCGIDKTRVFEEEFSI